MPKSPKSGLVWVCTLQDPAPPHSLLETGIRQQHSSSSAGFGNPNEALVCKALHEDAGRATPFLAFLCQRDFGDFAGEGRKDLQLIPLGSRHCGDPGPFPLSDKVFSMAEKGQPSRGLLSQTKEFPEPGVLSSLWRDSETPQ